MQIPYLLKHPIQFFKTATQLQKAIGTSANNALLRYVGNSVTFLDNRTEEYIEKGYLYNSYVYSVINLITKAAVRVPWVLYEVKDEKALRRYKSYQPRDVTREHSQALHYRSKALEEITDDFHQIYQTWDRPNTLQGQAEFLEQVLGFKLLAGNSYVHGVGPTSGANGGQFHELWPLPAQYMQIIPGGRTEPIQGYKLQLASETESERFDVDEILHLKYWNPRFSTDGRQLYGASPIQAHSRLLQRSNDSVTASAKLLQHSGAIGILSMLDEVAKEQGVENANRIQEKLEEKYGGAYNYGKWVVTAADVKWTSMGLNAVDLQILEMEKADLRHICNIYGVQSQLLNDPENKTYNNQQDARKALMLNVVLPELNMLRDELNRWWIPGFGEHLYFDYDIQAIPELQEDLDKLVDHLTSAWWVTGNEKRSAMGYDESDDPLMDQFLIPAGLMPMNTQLDFDEAEKRLQRLGVKDYQGNGHS